VADPAREQGDPVGHRGEVEVLGVAVVDGLPRADLDRAVALPADRFSRLLACLPAGPRAGRRGGARH
jgi:hypothetical protein